MAGGCGERNAQAGHVWPSGLPADRDADERRLERQGDERADREAEPLALDVDGDDRDPGRKAAHQAPELLAAAHRPDHTSGEPRLPAREALSAASDCRPLRDPAAIRRAVHWVLARPGLFLNTTSDATVLPAVLAAAAEAIVAPEDGEMQADVERHAMQPLFRVGGPDTIGTAGF